MVRYSLPAHLAGCSVNNPQQRYAVWNWLPWGGVADRAPTREPHQRGADLCCARLKRSLLLVCVPLSLAACGSGESQADPNPLPVVTAPAPLPPNLPPPVTVPPPPPASSTPVELARRAADYAMQSGARAVVIRSSQGILVERYGMLGGPEQGEPLASGSKSFSCPLLLLAEADGLLAIEHLASRYLVQWRPDGVAPDLADKASIRLDNLLSMTAGLANTGTQGASLNQVDSYAQAVMDRSASPADRAFRYGPNSFQAVLAVFQMATGGRARADGGVDGGLDPLIYLQSRLLQPIGINPTAWARDSRNQPNFGGGASMTARAWAAYGQFLIDGGRVGGQQILSSDALARCTSYRNPAFLPYGLGFWLNRDAAGSVGPDDQAPVTSEVRNRWQTGGRYAPSVPDSMYFAWGAGNAKLFMLPSHGLVAAKIGGGGDDDRFLGILIGSQN